MVGACMPYAPWHWSEVALKRMKLTIPILSRVISQSLNQIGLWTPHCNSSNVQKKCTMMQCLQSCCCTCWRSAHWHILHFWPSWPMSLQTCSIMSANTHLSSTSKLLNLFFKYYTYSIRIGYIMNHDSISPYIFRGLAQAMWFLARTELCCVWVPGKACLGRVTVAPNHDQHLSTNSQFIRCQHESYVIVHHCPSSSCLYCLFHCIPMSKTLFSQSELFSPRESRQPRESSEHCLNRLTGPEWCAHPSGTRWMHLSHLSLPTASLVAPATKYRRRLVRSSGVAWIWVAQESCSNRIKRRQNQEDLDIVVLYQLQNWKVLELRGGYHCWS